MYDLPKLLGLFYVEFHPIQGPKVIFEVPDSLITCSKIPNFDLEAISEFVIPKPNLCYQTLTLTLQNAYRIVGFPIVIENRKYERNALIFNLVWVFSQSAQVDIYFPIIKKLAYLIKDLETETSFLSDSTKKLALLPALEHILEDLNNMGETRITLSTDDSIHLKLFPNYSSKFTFELFHVPIPILNLNLLLNDKLDLTVEKLVKVIDGVKSVKSIIVATDIDPNLVKLGLEHLLQYECITFIDIFQYSNVYTVLPKLGSLLVNPTLQVNCIQYITKPGYQPLSLHHIFALYSKLKPGLSLKQFWVTYQSDLVAIDLRRFITFALLHKFIKRLYAYPTLQNESRSNLNFGLRKWLDGTYHTDHFALELNITPAELQRTVFNEEQVYIVYK